MTTTFMELRTIACISCALASYPCTIKLANRHGGLRMCKVPKSMGCPRMLQGCIRCSLAPALLACKAAFCSSQVMTPAAPSGQIIKAIQPLWARLLCPRKADSGGGQSSSPTSVQISWGLPAASSAGRLRTWLAHQPPPAQPTCAA